jgi:hypothetical protein
LGSVHSEVKERTRERQDQHIARRIHDSRIARERGFRFAEYLRAAMEDKTEPRVLLVALRREAEACGLG